MKPRVGEIVHYTNLGDRDGLYPPEPVAAIVTGLNSDGTISLFALYRTGGFNMASVAYAGDHAYAGTEESRGRWAWMPPR